ncbi:MAG: hypothetical protein HYU64_05935, partial [Armatimonadetes bacterium]|nr:hypothetical protein [Armatimonadota bacterium]
KTPFSTPTLSAVDSSRIADVKLAAEALARDLLEPKISGYYVRRAMKDAKYYATASDLPMGDQADLVDLGMKISAHPKVTNEKIKGDTENLRKAVENAVIAEQHSAEEEGSHGLSIYASYLQKAYDPLKSKNPITGLVEDTQRFSYRKLAFAQNSPWEEFLRNKFKIVS